MASRASRAVLFTTVFLDLIGFGIVIPLIAVYGKHYGASPLELGILGSAYSLTQFIFAPFWGALSDRVGRRPILLMSLAGSTGSYFLFAAADTYAWLISSRLLAGFFAANISVAEAYISDITPAEQRTSGMGLIGAAFGLGFILGPPIGGITAAEFGLAAPGIAAGTICGVNWIMAWFRLAESLPREQRISARRMSFPFSPASVREIVKIPLLFRLMCVAFFWTIALAHLEQCFTLLFQVRFFPETARASLYMGAVLGWSGLLGAFVQGLWLRRLERRVDSWNLLLTGLALSVPTFACFAYLPAYWSYFLIAIPLALAGGFVGPALSALVSLNTPVEKRGAIFGLSQSLSSLARALAPISAQLAFGWYYASPFLLAAGLTTIMFCWVACMLGAARARP